MKRVLRSLLALSCLTAATASAQVIYSNLLDTPIPLDFDGVTIPVGNGEINPFFGGYAVANDDNGDLQFFRVGTGGLDTIKNFAHGTVLDSSTTSLATGPGGSQDHIGTTFASGQEGYVGFKLDGNKFGWARVVFTNNSAGAVFRDWSYTSGNSIVVGGIRQVGQNIEISADMTLASALADSGGTTHLVTSNPGVATLTANHTYTGTTTVQSGSTLIVDGNIASTGVVTISAGGALGGSGAIGGSTVIQGTHNAGSPGVNAGVGSQSFGGSLTYESGSMFDWDINQSSTSAGFDTVSTSSGVTIDGGATFRVNFGGTALDDLLSPGNPFWNTTGVTRTWDLSLIFGSMPTGSFSGVTTNTDVTAHGYFSINGTSLAWTAIPEPSSAGGALLLGLGLLRRRR